LICWWVAWDEDHRGRGYLFIKGYPLPDFSRDVLLAKLTALLAVQNPLTPKTLWGIGVVNLNLK